MELIKNSANSYLLKNEYESMAKEIYKLQNEIHQQEQDKKQFIVFLKKNFIFIFYILFK